MFTLTSLTRRGFVRAAIAAACACGSGVVLGACSSGSDAAQNASADIGTRGESPTANVSSSVSDEQSQAWLEQDPLTRKLFYFDTVISLTAYCDDDLMNKVAARCQYFENTFSRTIEGTDVWRINEAQGRTVEVTEETADIISKALGYCRETDGLFDITIGSVTTLWDFALGIKPDDADIQEAVKHVDYTKVSVDTDKLTVTVSDPDTKIDLGGIAKGYIADDLARMFAEGGCKSASINLGGNAYVLGKKAGTTDWAIGIQDPNGRVSSFIASLKGADVSVVTSGLYERNFTLDGVEYYHILDPKTGYPVETDLVASSVISASSLDGDVYATTMFLMGHDAALEFIEQRDGFEGLVVDEDGTVTMTSGAPLTLK